MEPTRIELFIKVLIADDHPVVLEGLAAVLKDMEKVRVVSLVKHGNEVIEKIRQLSPSIVILDSIMPDFDVLTCIKEINELPQPPKIICCGTTHIQSEIMALAYAGISGYVSKSTASSDIKAAIMKVYNGGKFFTGDISEMIISGAIDKHNHPGLMEHKLFSDSELNIIQLICENKTVKEIGAFLNINVRTLEAYKNRIMKKMNAKNVVGIVSYAIKNNLVDLNTLPD